MVPSPCDLLELLDDVVQTFCLAILIDMVTTDVGMGSQLVLPFGVEVVGPDLVFSILDAGEKS